MPSKTKKQANAMRSACYGPPRKGGIPKDVACKYVEHDKAAKPAKKPRKR